MQVVKKRSIYRILKGSFYTGLFILFSFSGVNAQMVKSSKKSSLPFKYIQPLNHISLPDSIAKKPQIKSPMIFDADKLPLFCKIEHKLNRASGMNIKIRLGDADYVDKLEGKN